MTDFKSFYKVLIFDYFALIKFFRRYNGDYFSIFCILHGSRFSFLIIISAAFYSDRDSKVGANFVLFWNIIFWTVSIFLYQIF